MSHQQSSEQLQFVNRLNPVTGEMEWCLLPIDYDYRQEIACSAYGDMLHDTARNKAYFSALRRAINRMPKPIRVLDIGTGSGLLSMMAASLGADSVTACEAFEPVAACAQRVIAANGFLSTNGGNSGVKLVAKRSTDVDANKDLVNGERANLLVAELFDTELIGEGALQSFEDAAKRLLTPDAVVLPWEGRLRCALFQSDSLARYHYLQSGPWRHLPGAVSCPGLAAPLELQLSQLVPGKDFKLLTQPFEVRRFSFGPPSCLNNLPDNIETVSVSVPWLDSNYEGDVTGCFLWWDLLMDPWPGAELLSTEPSWAAASGEAQFREHWMQSVHFFPSPRRRQIGVDNHRLSHWHDGYGNYFDLESSATADKNCFDKNRFCSCGIHQAVSRSRLAETQDPAYVDSHTGWLRRLLVARPNRPLATVGDLCVLPRLLATLRPADSLQSVLCVEPRQRCRDILQAVTAAAAAADADFSEDSGGYDKAVIAGLPNLEDPENEGLILLAEPSFASSLLPWDELRFWHLAAAASSSRSKPAEIYPNLCRIMAAPVLFNDLHKLRSPVGPNGCEGFDLTEFDRLASPAADAAFPKLESQPLWEYPGQLLDEPQLLLELAWSKHFANAGNPNSIIEGDVCRFSPATASSAANGLAIWCDWFAQFDNSEPVPVLLTGIVSAAADRTVLPRQLNAQDWNRYRRQGVLMLSPGTAAAAAADASLTVSAKYQLDSAELTVSVHNSHC